MTADEHDAHGQEDPSLVEELGDLMRECLDRVRGEDPPEAWRDVYSRIDSLQARVDRQAARGVQCTYCGALRSTAELHVFELGTLGGHWDLCDRCWRMLEVGFQALHPGVDLVDYLARAFTTTDVMLRGYTRLGGALLARKGAM
jgi:hypothetical protein